MANVIVHGPMFEPGVPEMVIAAWLEQAVDEVAHVGEGLVLDILGADLVNPTGFYESQVGVDRFGERDRIVNDNDVIYGPWLEGVSSRNRTTRFKGYHAFRRAYQELREQAPAIAEAMIWPAIARLNL